MNFAKPLLRAATKASAGLLCAATAASAWAVNDSIGGPKVNQLNLPYGVTEISKAIYDLHIWVMIVCVVIFVVVFGVMFYSVFAHRKSKGAIPATWHESVKVEIAWTIVPFIIVIGLALPATKTVVAMKDTTNSDLTIKATGYQWRWGYDYLKGEGEGISFISSLATDRNIVGNPVEHIAAKPAGDNYLMEVDHPVVVPVNKKVRIITTADDVIHAWAIPQFGVKQDAIPGFVRDTWFKAEKIGVYRGQCQELCGKEHAFMPIVVDVRSAEDYSKWVDEQQKLAAAQKEDPNKTWVLSDLVARGEKVYSTNCVACHQANGKGIPGAIPALDGSKTATGPIAGHLLTVLNGRTGTAMASWKQLSDTEIAAVVTYERNSWGNKVGDMLQPHQVTEARSGKMPDGGTTAAAPAADAPAVKTSQADATRRANKAI